MPEAFDMLCTSVITISNCSVYVLLLTSVSDPVENLTVDFVAEDADFDRATRMYNLPISISWQQPLEPNGNLSGYLYSLHETSNSSNCIIPSTFTAEINILNAVDVEPFVNYTVQVLPVNGAGEGMPVSVDILSPQAG